MKQTIQTLLFITTLVAGSPAATVSCETCGATGQSALPKLATSYVVAGNPPAGDPCGVSDQSSITCGEKFDNVVFNEESGYGSFPTIRLEQFLWDVLNATCNAPREPMMALPKATDSIVVNPASPTAVPELGSSMIGGLGMLLLLRRRRF